MILADTSVWVEHLRSGDAWLADLLRRGRVLGHPFVTAEVALGSLRNREEVLGALDGLGTPVLAQISEVRALIEERRLFARGIGLVDASLLASCLLTPGTRLWTRDRRLHAAALELGVGTEVA